MIMCIFWVFNKLIVMMLLIFYIVWYRKEWGNFLIKFIFIRKIKDFIVIGEYVFLGDMVRVLFGYNFFYINEMYVWKLFKLFFYFNFR